MTFPAFTDLTALAAVLSKNGKHGALKKALVQAWRAESCLGDLRQAQYCCDALRKRRVDQAGPSDEDGHVVEKSLLMTALLLYSRATHTAGKGGERGAITLQRGQLTIDQWKDHEELISLRNQAVAHVNPEHRTGERVWHKLLFFAVRLPSGIWKPACASNETSFHRETFERLERALKVAHEVLQQQFSRRMAAVVKKINDAEVPENLLQSNLFDPVNAFGSAEIVRRLLQGASQSTDSFWCNE